MHKRWLQFLQYISHVLFWLVTCACNLVCCHLYKHYQALQGKNFLLVHFDNAFKLISSILITFFSVIPLYDGGLTHFSARRLVVCTVLAISPSERGYMMSDIIRLVEQKQQYCAVSVYDVTVPSISIMSSNQFIQAVCIFHRRKNFVHQMLPGCLASYFKS